jgi:hypothetical protein
MVHGGATQDPRQQPTGRGSSVNVSANVFLSSSSTVECTEVMGLPTITVSDGAIPANHVTLFLGDTSRPDGRAAAIDQLDQLASAVLASRMILDDHLPELTGPDDDDDEPTDAAAAELGSDPLYPGIVAADWSDHGADREAAAELVTGGKHGYRIDFDGPSRTWEVYSVRHGEAIATGLTLSGAVREVEDLTAQDRAELERNGGHLDGCEGSCVAGCPTGGARRTEANARAASAQAAWTGQELAAVRQAHPMTENEARAAWGDR